MGKPHNQLLIESICNRSLSADVILADNLYNMIFVGFMSFVQQQIAVQILVQIFLAMKMMILLLMPSRDKHTSENVDCK